MTYPRPLGRLRATPGPGVPGSALGSSHFAASWALTEEAVPTRKGQPSRTSCILLGLQTSLPGSMEEPGPGCPGDMPDKGEVPALRGMTVSQAAGISVEETVTDHLLSNWVTGK